ncbi:MAG: hypothetical protein K9H61_03120 [Bacteroidia bacterium]|nr:hypothetical protein [Bacteroidia bacterium]MCF8426696.1 hypothetical protein [Bacteroidia bacterium]MCF8445964.1 hypothetical protein [Bacteroidia bacterium]
MNTENNKWIEEILDSTQNMQPAQMPQELDQKILAKIQLNQFTAKRIEIQKIRWVAAAAVLLVFINFWVLRNNNSSQKMGMNNPKTEKQMPFSSGSILNM